MSALALSVDQLLAIEADPSSNNLPPGDTWTVTDTAANLETLSLGAISAMPSVGVTAIAAHRHAGRIQRQPNECARCGTDPHHGPAE